MSAHDMSYYRLYVFNDAQHAIQSFDMIAADLSAAALRARRATVDTDGSCGFELWQSAPPVRGGNPHRWLLVLKERGDERLLVA
jgi:hypothetical protein